MRHTLNTLVALAFLLAAPALYADYLEVGRDSNVYRQPDSDSDVVAQVETGALLELLNDGKQRNGFYRVRTIDHGFAGWIYRARARRRDGNMPEGFEPEPPPESLAAIRKAKKKAKCGVERWVVKTLNDAEAASIDLNQVTNTTIDELNDLPPSCKLGPKDGRSRDEERTVYEFVGRVTFAKNEPDRDVHLAIEDPESGRSIVAEIVDPACPEAKDSPHVQTLRAVRADFLDTVGNVGSSVGALVRVRGVGFFDKRHGQRGASESCLEIHPVVGIDFLEQ